MFTSPPLVFVFAVGVLALLAILFSRLGIIDIRAQRPSTFRLLALGAVIAAFASYLMLSEQIATDTMSDDLRQRVSWACIRGRTPTFPFKTCNVTWWSAVEYVTARAVFRVRPADRSGAACGDERSVYRALMENNLLGVAQHGVSHDPGRTVFVVEDSVSPSQPTLDEASDLEETFWGLQQSTIEDFVAKNAQATLLDSATFAPEGVLLPAAIRDSLVRLALGGGNWFSAFYHRYPAAKALVTLSRPGISADRRQALIEVGTRHAPLRGMGVLALLACKEGKWVVADAVMTWAS